MKRLPKAGLHQLETVRRRRQVFQRKLSCGDEARGSPCKLRCGAHEADRRAGDFLTSGRVARTEASQSAQGLPATRPLHVAIAPRTV